MKRLFDALLRNVRASAALSRAGGSLCSRAKLFFLWWWWGIGRRFRLKKARPVRMVVGAFGRTALCTVDGFEDLVTLKEIFVDREYNVQAQAPEHILDLGAHKGLATIFFKLKYPNACVYAFEPSPTSFKLLQENTRQFGTGVRVHQVAVSDKDGASVLRINPEWSTSSSLAERAGNTEAVEVRTQTLDAIMENCGCAAKVDVVKFDIEGAEYAVFACARFLGNIRALVGEVHYDLMRESREKFLSVFSDFLIEERPAGDSRSLVTMRAKAYQ